LSSKNLYIHILLYDKSKESFDRYGSISSTKSLIECRLNFKNLTDEEYDQSLWDCYNFVNDYFGSYASWQRCNMFLKMVNTNLVATTVQRINGINSIAPWYFDLIITPLQHFVEMFGRAWREFK
jgi:hypothetical protein